MDIKTQPKTLEECFEILDSFLQDKEQFKNSPEENVMGVCHMSLGLWLRNNWYLWWSEELRDKVTKSNHSKLPMEKIDYPQEMPELVKWFRDKGLKHADDMSGVIIISYHRKLNDKPLDVDKQILKSINYYKTKNIELP